MKIKAPTEQHKGWRFKANAPPQVAAMPSYRPDLDDTRALKTRGLLCLRCGHPLVFHHNPSYDFGSSFPCWVRGCSCEVT